MTRAEIEALCRQPRQGYDPDSTANGCEFHPDAALDVIRFFETALHHIEGHVADRPFILEDWQKWTLGNLFGWKRPDGTRRYREAFIYVPRKNGKTPLAAGIVLYTLAFDNEPGAQVYSAAAERDQAALIHRHASGMIQRHPALDGQFRIYRGYKSIEHGASGSHYKALSAEAKSKHGFNAHCVVVDEEHAHEDGGELVRTLETAFASRLQPMFIHITTADYFRESICNTKYDYATKVRDGVFEDASFFPVIYEATTEDDWTDPAVWEKANPNIDVSVRREYLERECEKAKAEPSYLNTFLRLHLNVRTNADVAAFDLNDWDACAQEFKADDMEGQPCYGGLDLSKTTDLTAFSLYFPGTDRVLCWAWIPEDTAHKAERRDRVPYSAWRREGWLEFTPGNVVDYTHVRDRIRILCGKYAPASIAFDPWNATEMAQELQSDGADMQEFRQGPRSFNEPCKLLDRLVVSHELGHNGNPLLRWCASNLMWRRDPNDNIAPDKQKSTGRIDCVVATAMAIGRAIVTEEVGPSVYETRGLRTL